MSAIKWTGKTGDWMTGADWKGGVAPGVADDATISAPGTYTVTISSADAVHSLTVNDSNALLSVDRAGTLTLGSTLDLTAGTLRLEAGGVISGGTLNAQGSVSRLAMP